MIGRVLRLAQTVALCAVCASTVVSAPLRVVSDHRSSYRIYRAPDAPSSVRVAAEELREYLRLSTGAELEVVIAPAAPMICLGENAAAREAGFSTADIPLEGYRIAASGENLHILGPDTADGAMTPLGGGSTGTLNGVYAFLERELGVRWLMPGPHGDSVPQRAEIAVRETNRTEAPCFVYRRIVDIWDESSPAAMEAVRRWQRRQRLGGSSASAHGHAWRETVPPELYGQHPEYFAMFGGERVDPVKGPSEKLFLLNPALARGVASDVEAGRYMLCTTNPALVKAYADAVLKYFDQNPDARVYSLSPSDTDRFCTCANCEAMKEASPKGGESATRLVYSFALFE